MQHLRIALFTYSTKPRGSVIHTLELADALDQLGHEVSIYALDKDGTGFDRPLRCAYHPVPALPVVGDFDHLIQQRIQEFVNYLGNGHLAAHPYDCYHAQDCLSANALAILRQQQQIPHFLRTVHHIDAFNSPYLQHCQDRSIREADVCFCVSQYWQDQLRQEYGIDAPKVINGVDWQRFAKVGPNIGSDIGSDIGSAAQAELKQQLGLGGDPIYLTVGGIEPRKNSIRLLQAFAQVLQHRPQAQLVIAGGATLFDYQPYRDQFFAEVDRLGIPVGQALILPGVVADRDLPTLYHLADAFVFPSLKEGWGLVLLEAIAAGLPVIVSDQPPFTEFLATDQALWIAPESVEAIAEAMLAVADPQVAAGLAQQSQTLAEQLAHKFSWENSAKIQVDHYKRLLNYA